jgi:hypothetical protein
MDMTIHQKLAIRRPCFEAEETTYAGFGWRTIDPTVTLRLTMNIGME